MNSKSLLQPQPLSLPENPQVFAEQLLTIRDVSEATRTDYKQRIGLFVAWVEDNGFHRNTLLDYKRSLADRADISVSTKNKYFATAKIFLKELNRQGLLPADITQNIKGFSQDKKHKRDGLTDSEIHTLVQKIGQLPTTAENTRLRAIISLLALQGLRQIEVVRLDVRDIDPVAKRAYILGKGRDDKEPIDLHPETVKALSLYFQTNSRKSGALFVSTSNNNRNRRLTTRTIRDIVKRELTRVGIAKTTHGFRHYFTTTLVKKFQGNLLDVAQYTRHRSIEMLQVYYDRVKKEEDLPKYYGAFDNVSF